MTKTYLQVTLVVLFLFVSLPTQLYAGSGTVGSFYTGYEELDDTLITSGIGFSSVDELDKIKKIRVLIVESGYNRTTREYEQLVDLKEDRFESYLNYDSDTGPSIERVSLWPGADYDMELAPECVAGGASCNVITITNINVDKIKENITGSGYLLLYVSPYETLQVGTMRIEWELYDDVNSLEPYLKDDIELPTEMAILRGEDGDGDTTPTENEREETIPGTDNTDSRENNDREEFLRLKQEVEELQNEVERQKGILERIMDFFRDLRVNIFG